MKEVISKAIKYLTEDIWRIQKFQLSRPHVIIINTLRILYLAIKGFIYDKCQQKASALTFYSLMSVVPLVALLYGIALGFGFDETLKLELTQKMAGQEEVLSYILDLAERYVKSTKSGIIIGVGLVILFWSVMQVLGNIEQSFNDIWEVKRSRSFARKFTDYIALMIVAFLFLISSSSMIVFVSAKFNNYEVLSYLGSTLTMVMPYVIICLAFTMLILIMPNTKVNVFSAIVGGVVAGVLFQVLQYYFIHFMVGVSRYNAIYGSFAALPLFLFWMQASWLIVMFGAEISFAIQNVDSFEFAADTKNISVEYKRVVALLLCYEVIKRFEQGKEPVNTLMLSVHLKLPIRLINEIVFDLVKSNVLIEVAKDGRGETAYQPALDINKLSVSVVLNMLETTGSKNLHFEETEDMIKVKKVVERFKEMRASSTENVLLKDL
ncbi:YihY/virulence factor BrkB family protein [Plebeiibacterium sediminum]|uniref:YihY/virulence factor BrkB family protein n=1 Tax=Plebeiibacterium sediminum TaxID=2992112 RepID=A0AAE3SF03_9BACT|nr:YihY/virulence factor BrkB family protein [Plebeiobacterium sediminum]MCW3787033.1 YihY/virulence factor BrkB family protein [Plebeiobacterium sediminum]